MFVAVLSGGRPVRESPVAVAVDDASLDPFELLANGEDLDLVENDLAFYDWLDVTGLDAAGSAG